MQPALVLLRSFRQGLPPPSWQASLSEPDPSMAAVQEFLAHLILDYKAPMPRLFALQWLADDHLQFGNPPQQLLAAADVSEGGGLRRPRGSGRGGAQKGLTADSNSPPGLSLSVASRVVEALLVAAADPNADIRIAAATALRRLASVGGGGVLPPAAAVAVATAAAERLSDAAAGVRPLAEFTVSALALPLALALAGGGSVGSAPVWRLEYALRPQVCSFRPAQVARLMEYLFQAAPTVLSGIRGEGPPSNWLLRMVESLSPLATADPEFLDPRLDLYFSALLAQGCVDRLLLLLINSLNVVPW